MHTYISVNMSVYHTVLGYYNFLEFDHRTTRLTRKHLQLTDIEKQIIFRFCLNLSGNHQYEI